MRLIIDNFGNRHNDLFLILDSPWHLKIADSYYIYDFLEISDETFDNLKLAENEILKYAINVLLNYWTERIKAIENGQSKFIPFDFNDQYIGGIMLEKTKKGFKIKLVCTDNIAGYSIGRSNLDEQIISNKIEFKDSQPTEWLISEEGLFNGLEWSKKELTNKNDA